MSPEQFEPFEERKLRAVVAEDSAVVREGVSRILRDAGIEVVAEVATAPDLLEAVAQHRPDVVVTDIRMPPTNTFEGLRAAEQIHRDHPTTGVVVLSQYVESRAAVGLMTSNPRGIGYLLKDRVADPARLVSVVRNVPSGGSAVDPEIVAHLMERRQVDQSFERLSPREREVLALMAQGRSNSGICATLFLSPKTVETHVTNIFNKLELPPADDDHRRVLAVLTYLRSI